MTWSDERLMSAKVVAESIASPDKSLRGCLEIEVGPENDQGWASGHVQQTTAADQLRPKTPAV